MIITPQDQWSIICSRISQSDHESPAWWTQDPKWVSVMSEVCGRPSFLHLEALGFVLRLMHTDYAKYYIAGH